QILSNTLGDIFIENGGEIILSKKVSKIKIKYNTATGVILEDKTFYKSHFVVSNIDASQTYRELIDVKYNTTYFMGKLNKLISSYPVAGVFLGLNKRLGREFKDSHNIWYSNSYEIDYAYRFLEEKKINIEKSFLLLTIPSFIDRSLVQNDDYEVVKIEIYMPLLGMNYWNNDNKLYILEKVIKKVEELIPNIDNCILLKDIATPHSFYKYTLNSYGASRGWACNQSQISSNIIPSKSHIESLFLCGHWTTSGFGQGGIGMVAYSGKNVAYIIKNRIKK
ncbi:MAG: hypothetical protein AB1847_13290, partial [bacterium]